VFNEVTDGLNSVSIVFDDEVLAGIILGEMPESWSTTPIDRQLIRKRKVSLPTGRRHDYDPGNQDAWKGIRGIIFSIEHGR